MWEQVCKQVAVEQQSQLERQAPKTNWPLADGSTGNWSVKKPSLLLKAAIFMGRLWSAYASMKQSSCNVAIWFVSDL